MERGPLYQEVKLLMGDNFISWKDINRILPFLADFKQGEIPIIPFSIEELKIKKDTHFLIWVCDKSRTGEVINLLSLKNHFGSEPFVNEPCFYFQDWYEKEVFFNKPISAKWLLISKDIIGESRAVSPTKLDMEFPSAVELVYVFLITYLIFKSPVFLNNTYAWANDLDANHDQIYIGKYTDPLGLNKHGIEIHRHLSLKLNYGALDSQ